MADEKKEQKGTESEHINLNVLGLDNVIVNFTYKKHAPLGKLLNAYCHRAGISKMLVRFRFEGDNILDTDTIKLIGIEEGDTIEVYQDQLGGRD